MKKLTKTLALLLCISLLLGALPMLAGAADAVKYTVKDGDCLYAIARTLMGNGAKWPELYEANKSVIGSNPRLIYTGTVLTIPGGTTTPAAPGTPVVTEPAAPAAPAEPADPAEPAKPVGEPYTVYESLFNPAKLEEGGAVVKDFGFFDTGIVPTAATRVQMDCTYEGNWDGQCFFGSGIGGSNTKGYTLMLRTKDDGTYSAYYGEKEVTLPGNVNLTNRVTVDFNYADASGRSVSVTDSTGKKAESALEKTDMTFQNPLMILGCRKDTAAQSNYARPMTLYSVKITDNPAAGTETLIAEYVAAADKDGKIGLLDLVSGKFLTSELRPTATFTVDKAVGTAYVDNGKVTYIPA